MANTHMTRNWLLDSHGPESRNDSNLTLTLNQLMIHPVRASVTLIQIHTHPFRASVNRIQSQTQSLRQEGVLQ